MIDRNRILDGLSVPKCESKPKPSIDRHPRGCITKHGRPLDKYATTTFDGKSVLAHRLVYAIANELSVDDVGIVHHRCGNAGCLNPLHLAETTRAGHMKAHAIFDMRKRAAAEFGTPEPEWIELAT